MDTLSKRLLTFFIGLPAVIALVLFLPYQNNLLLNIFVILFSCLGAIEFSLMLKKKQLFISKTEAGILGALAPAALTISICFNLPPIFSGSSIVPLILITGALWVLLSRSLSQTDKISSVTNYITAGFSVIIYPGFFLYWLVKMTTWGNAYIILLFLLITFGFDSAAWLAGTLFGKNNRGMIPASPNKSIAGYIGGLFGAILVSTVAALIFPGIFPVCQETPVISLVLFAVILGFCTGVAAGLGDLAESAMKRSCDVKDSGKIMFGRGGILDSIDSIAVAAPVFYILFSTVFFTH